MARIATTAPLISFAQSLLMLVNSRTFSTKGCPTLIITRHTISPTIIFVRGKCRAFCPRLILFILLLLVYVRVRYNDR